VLVVRHTYMLNAILRLTRKSNKAYFKLYKKKSNIIKKIFLKIIKQYDTTRKTFRMINFSKDCDSVNKHNRPGHDRL